MTRIKNAKFLLVTAALVWFGLMAVMMINQPVTATPAHSRLTPPFTFEQAATSNAANIGFPYPGNTVIFTETFGASFAPTTTLDMAIPAWHVAVNPGASDYYWGRVNTGVFSDSAWSAVSTITSTTILTPGVDFYPADQDTWLIYGPLDLSKFAAARLTFDYYLDSEPGDWFGWGASYDGQTFYGSSTSGHLSGGQWYSATFDLDNAHFATDQVYIGFAFKSGAAPSGLGAFIRNVELLGNPLKYTYVPAIFNAYAAPTLTPTPTATPIPHAYTFDEGDPNAAGTDLSEWGGKYKGTSSGSGGTYEFGQFAPTNPFHGNPGSSLRLYNDAFWVMTASSPGVVSPDNYDLYVDISPWILYPRDRSCGQSCPPDDLGNWYGIIFNARSSTFGSNPSQFHYNDKYYRLYFYNIDAAKPIALKLDRCDGDGNNPCVNLSTKSVPASFIGSAGGWDHIHITRDGTLIRVSINGTVVISKNDGTFTGGGKYGVFIFPSDGNDVTYPPSGYEMQVDFDNIKLYGR